MLKAPTWSPGDELNAQLIEELARMPCRKLLDWELWRRENSTETSIWRFFPRWWFQIPFIFIPNFGEDEPSLTSIFFEMGWFNHQPVGRFRHHLLFEDLNRLACCPVAATCPCPCSSYGWHPNGKVVFQPSIFRYYCWWKKSCTSWNGKYIIYYNFLQGFLYIQKVVSQISEPSTVY